MCITVLHYDNAVSLSSPGVRQLNISPLNQEKKNSSSCDAINIPQYPAAVETLLNSVICNCSEAGNSWFLPSQNGHIIVIWRLKSRVIQRYGGLWSVAECLPSMHKVLGSVLHRAEITASFRTEFVNWRSMEDENWKWLNKFWYIQILLTFHTYTHTHKYYI